jgi:hypothetical protein
MLGVGKILRMSRAESPPGGRQHLAVITLYGRFFSIFLDDGFYMGISPEISVEVTF